MNAILYEEYGLKSFSNCFACKRSTIERKPELCEAFIEGAMEGLKYVYLNPEKSVDLHIESVKEFQGGNPANRDVIKYGQLVSTALGLDPAVQQQHGLGYMDPALVEATRATVETYMGARGTAPSDQLFTNKFAGSVKLSPAEWTEVSARTKNYMPAR